MAAKKGIMTPMQPSLAKRAPDVAPNANLNKAGHVFTYKENRKVDSASKVLAPMQDIPGKGK